MVNNKFGDFQTAHEYLRWEYGVLNSKKGDLKDIDLEIYFKLIENKYGNNQKELYESDKILFKKLKEIASNLDLPIDEQDSSSYWILNRHCENVIRVAQENNIFIPDNIILGTLPIDDLSAFTCSFPQGQRLVALNEGLFSFLYLMGRSVSSFFSKKKNDGNKISVTFEFNKENIKKNIKANKEGHTKFLETLILYVAYRDFSISKTYYEKDENKLLSVILWDTAELFVVAHEYSHIILDKLSQKKEYTREFLHHKSKLYKIARNWNEEFSADEVALQITIRHNENEGNGLLGGYIGIEFLFACFDIIEKIYNVKFSETHPSAEMRINHLREYLNATFPEEAEQIISVSSLIKDVVIELWETNKEIFYEKITDIKNSYDF